jgi:hypothetical protein
MKKARKKTEKSGFPKELSQKMKVPTRLVDPLRDLGPDAPYDNEEVGISSLCWVRNHGSDDIYAASSLREDRKPRHRHHSTYYDYIEDQRRQGFNKLCEFFQAGVPVRHVGDGWEPCHPWDKRKADIALLTYDCIHDTDLSPEALAWRKLAMGLIEQFYPGWKKPDQPKRGRGGTANKQKSVLLGVAREYEKDASITTDKKALESYGKLVGASISITTLTKAKQRFGVPRGQGWWRWALANVK